MKTLPFALVALTTLSGPALAAGFQVTSPAFEDGATLPAQYAGPDKCGGKNMSPPLAWSGAPAGAKSFAITEFDPDARNGAGFVHWVAYNIPAATTSVAEGVALPPSGNNGTGKSGYLGSCPPVGDKPHHYQLTVYALDLPVDVLKPGLSYDDVMKGVANHALASAKITALFSR